MARMKLEMGGKDAFIVCADVTPQLEVATDVGPRVSDPQRAKVMAQLEAATSAGAEVLTGGDRGGQERGHFLSPRWSSAPAPTAPC